MPRRGPQLEDWEVALIRAMLASGRFRRKQDVLPYFNRPERTVNQARISQIAAGAIYPDVAPATDAQVNSYLASWTDRSAARSAFITEDPCGATAIGLTLRTRSQGRLRLDVEESDHVEWKEAFNWAGRGAYAKTMAGFANNRGGYLIFGVRNESKEIIGISGSAFQGRDPSDISQFLNECFAPHIRWMKAELSLAGMIVGALYVWPAERKPVVCTRQVDDLRDGDIYFRYVGETRRIKATDLHNLIDQRLRDHERILRQSVTRLVEIGAQNAAVLDTLKGTVVGPHGSFLIDESLIDKLHFLREGHFIVDDGAPALKLIGDLRPIGTVETGRGRVEKQMLSDADILDIFLSQQTVPNPIEYVKALAHLPCKWMPVYFFLSQANASVADGIRSLESVEKPYVAKQSEQIARLRDAIHPGEFPGKIGRGLVPQLVARTPITVTSREDARLLLVGIRRLAPAQIDAQYILPLMRSCFEYYRSGDSKAGSVLDGEIRASAAHVDSALWAEKVPRGDLV
jgi:hypothetical protein